MGIKIDGSQLEKLATLATTARGSSPVGGDFICNEYKDLFLLKYEGSVSDLKFSPDEVAAVDSKHWTQVKEDLLAQVQHLMPCPSLPAINYVDKRSLLITSC